MNPSQNLYPALLKIYIKHWTKSALTISFRDLYEASVKSLHELVVRTYMKH